MTGSSSVFSDPRGPDRALRVTWHHETDLVVLSLWRSGVCAGSFRLPADEVADLIALLREGLPDYDGAVAPAAEE